MASKPLVDDWYRYPKYYDIAFQGETKREADFVQQLAPTFARRPLQSVLEPGCGSGRLALELAKRGFRITAFDICQESVDFTAKRMRRFGQAQVFRADMVDFSVPEPVDLMVNPCNTFRHLLTEADALAHLRCAADHLAPGGLYVLGLHLFPPDADDEDCERWTEARGKTKVTATLRVLKNLFADRIEWIRMSLLVRDANKPPLRIRSDFPLRTYNRKQLLGLLAKEPRLELCEVFDFWYDVPVPLDDHISDTVLVLRKTAV